jgi:hypothetical protein
MQAACQIDLYGDDPASASARLAAAWPHIDRIGLLRIQHLRIELLSLRARIALADTRRALEDRIKLARSIADELIKEGASWAIGIGLMVRAATCQACDDHDGALAALVSAEQHLESSEMHGWFQVARLRRGMLEGGASGAARAEAARDLLNELGAANPDRIAAVLAPWP